MKNQKFTGSATSRRFALCPTTVKAGDAVLLGTSATASPGTGLTPAVALDDYQSLTGGSTFLLNGSFRLSITAESSLSVTTGKAINPGDPVYMFGQTKDSPTNMWTGGTLCAESSDGTLFGYLDPDETLIASRSGTRRASPTEDER